MAAVLFLSSKRTADIQIKMLPCHIDPLQKYRIGWDKFYESYAHAKAGSHPSFGQPANFHGRTAQSSAYDRRPSPVISFPGFHIHLYP